MTSSLVHLKRRSIDRMRALLCKIMIMLVQKVSFSKLGLQLGEFKERTQLVSNKSPETKIFRSSEASASDLAQSCLNLSSKMLEDLLDHKVKHMRNRPCNPDKIIVGSANYITLYEHVYMMRLASRSALRVRYNTAIQLGAASQRDALHTPTQDDSSLEQSHVL
jgi:hypothetical protein